MKKFDDILNMVIDDANLQSDMATVNVSLGLNKRRAKDYMNAVRAHRICDKCGFHIMKSRGRYPAKCPNCGDIVNDADKEVKPCEEDVNENTSENK